MERIEKKPGDFVLFVTFLLLAGIGLAVLFSASFHYAMKLTGDPYHFFRRQLIWALLGAAAGIVASRTPLRFFDQAAPPVLLITLALMVLPFLPFFGRPILGARRWILLFGLSFEPLEAAKLALVLYLARIFSRKGERMNEDPTRALLPPLIVVGALVGLTYLQNNFSSASFLLFIALGMFFVARVKLRYFFLLGLVALPVAVLLMFSQAYRVQRLIAYLNPLADPSGSGFQLIASRSALVNGGLWGRGLGRGTVKLGGLPEAHSDFIFAVAGEEMGFIGALAILLLFLIVAWRGYRICLAGGDGFRASLAFGITSTVFCQALLNIAVVAGLVPATGVPLPFFSSGGSSILVTLLMSGLLYNLSRAERQSSPARSVSVDELGEAPADIGLGRAAGAEDGAWPARFPSSGRAAGVRVGGASRLRPTSSSQAPAPLAGGFAAGRSPLV